MTARIFDRWLGRALHVWGAAAALALLSASAYGLGTISRETGWPYEIIDRQLVSDRVERGGEIGMRRLIEYHTEDCWRQYDRRAVSLVQVGDRPGMVYRFEPYVDQRLPVDLSGKWQTWTDRLPEDFTCGPAYLAETVTAACTWWQRAGWYLRKPDVITPFVVACAARG